MNKKILTASIFATVILLLTSFYSVANAHTINSNDKKIIRLIDSIKTNYKDILLKKVDSNEVQPPGIIEILIGLLQLFIVFGTIGAIFILFLIELLLGGN